MRDWSPATRWPGSQASHLRSTKPATDSEIELLEMEAPIVRAFYARVEPGGFIVPHIDAGPWWDRWHYPIETGGWFWQLGEAFCPTEPFRVFHWLPHAVWNDSEVDRVHLIVDWEAPPPFVMPPDRGLVLCDMLPEVQALIDQIEVT